jgi:hypothetical protein
MGLDAAPQKKLVEFISIGLRSHKLGVLWPVNLPLEVLLWYFLRLK